MSNKNPE